MIFLIILISLLFFLKYFKNTIEPIEKKMISFNWNVIKINGHSFSEIDYAMNKKFKNQKPTFIIANTIKGKGISYMENKPLWHGSVKMNEEHIRPKTKATAIQIGKPANLLKGLRALEFTDGVVTTVTDNEMLDGMSIVGLNGFDCEMASGAVPAGIKKLLNENVIKKDDKIIGILTGRQKEPLLPINYHNEPTNQFAIPPKR